MIRFLLFGFTLLSFLTVLGQNSNDSLKVIWEDETQPDSIRFEALAEHYKLNNQSQPDSALKVLDFHYALAKSKKNASRMFQAANGKGNIYRLKGNYDVAMKAYKEAETLANKLQDSVLQANVNGNIGNVYVYNQDYLQATKYFSKSLKTYQKLGNSDGESHMLTSLGSVFLIINNYDLALEYYQNSLSILNERGFEDRRTAIIYINIGWTNYEKELYENARINYEKGLELLQVNNDKFFIANCYATLAKIHTNLNQLSKAQNYADKNLALNKELGIEEGTTEAEIINAQLEYKNDVNKATMKAENILAALNPTFSKKLKINLYELLYKCYKSQNKPDLSLAMFEKYSILKDSIQQEKNNFAVVREAVKNDFEIQLHKVEKENQRTQSDIKLKQRIRIYILSFLSLAVLGLVYWNFKSRVAKQEKQKTELLKEIKTLKSVKSESVELTSPAFSLDRNKLEVHINRKLNETDWSVLKILLEDPVISNKGIAEKAFLSVDGIGSSLRRMYQYFEIKESKYKKISLLMTAMQLCS